MYAKCFKRVIDFTLSLIALICLSPILLVLIIVDAIARKVTILLATETWKERKRWERKDFLSD